MSARALTADELVARLKVEMGAREDYRGLVRTWPRPGCCDCHRPARSPRGTGPDQCMVCRRPLVQRTTP